MEEDFFWKVEIEKENETLLEDTFVTPPQIPPAPSPMTGAVADMPETDLKGSPDTPNLQAYREAYCRQFAAYNWQEEPDDRFLRQVLDQIRYKLALTYHHPNLSLADIPDQPVFDLFTQLIQYIPDWHVERGFTTPRYLLHYFDCFYTACQISRANGIRLAV